MKPATVSNLSPTIYFFLQKLTSLYQEMNFVYREDLDYTEALKKFRSENLNSEEDNTYPLFIYNRSVLRFPEDGPGRRVASHHTMKDNTEERFRITHAEFDIDFALASLKASALEEFEISYLSNEGISSIKEISYELPGFGTWNFYINFQDLESKSIQLEDNFHKLLVGKVSVRGFYFIAKGTSKRISNIQATLSDFSTKINYETIIL